MEAVLLELGTSGDGGDFWIARDLPEDRVIVVEILHERMVSHRLLTTLHGLLQQIEPDYLISIGNSAVYLKRPNGERYPTFFLFVTRASACIYSADDNVVKCFGGA